MSQAISATLPAIRQDSINTLPTEAITAPKGEQTEQKAPLPTDRSRAGEFLFKALEKMTGGHKLNDKKSLKAFSHLSNSLEKAFSSATKVNHKTGEEEIKQGGLHRIGKDLSKLFKGMGVPPQLAKQFSGSITQAMGKEGVEQIDFSMTSSRSLSIEASEFQAGYLSDGDGTMIAGAVANSFQLSAVQTRSFDLSINLRTGEFSMEYSKEDSLSISTSSTAILASSTPAEQIPSAQTPTEDDTQSTPVETPAKTPAESSNDVAMMFQSESSMLEISRAVQLSALMHVQPASAVNDESALPDKDTSFAGLSRLQQLFERMEELNPKAKGLFDSLTMIRDMRIEKEDDDDHLRFSVEALAPVGLTAIDDTEHATTLFPRPDGSLGTVADDAIEVTV